MRLIKARVQNYRSLEDSGWVDIEGRRAKTARTASSLHHPRNTRPDAGAVAVAG